MFWVNNVIFEVDYECPQCGATGSAEVEGMIRSDGSGQIYEFVCPHCGCEIEREDDEF